MKLVLVVGPPRSGTSVVARIMHEKLGICMGHNLVPGNAGNPLGFYEDAGMVAAVKTKDILTIISALHATHKVVDDIIGIYRPCSGVIGVKTPDLAFIQVSSLLPDLIIRTRRPGYDIIASLMRWQQPRVNKSEAYLLAMKYEKALDGQFMYINPNKIEEIDMSARWDEEDLEEELWRVCASVVQRQEYMALNHGDEGSNPSGGTRCDT